MSIQIIKERIARYSPMSIQEEENVIKEIYQEIALAGLSRAGFFKIAAFQGGTCLRIVYGLNRFSEDLDFLLMRPDREFSWGSLLDAIKAEFAIYGIELNVIEMGLADKVIRTAVLKDDSFKRVFQLSYKRDRLHKQLIKIKFEVDPNPPLGSRFDTHYLDFPLPFSIVSQDQPSLFASKCHALLCRSFLKGRDWYDFLWYVSRRTSVNLEHLRLALIQSNHWLWDADEPLTKNRLCTMICDRITAIDWRAAAEDVAPLLKPVDREGLKGWKAELFLSYVEKLKDYLKGPQQPAVIFRIGDGPAPRLDNRLFSGAVSDFDQEEIDRINTSGTYWCQSIHSISVLEDKKTYKVLFVNLDYPGEQKDMAAHAHFGDMKFAKYIPGQIYDLPGWFIKDWNSRRIVHYHGIYRALYWFQPVDIIPPETLKTMQEYVAIKRQTP